MDDIAGPHVSEKLFNWAWGVMGAIASFFTTVMVYYSRKINRIDKELAVNSKGDEAVRDDIHDIKKGLIVTNKKIDTILLVVQEQKEMYNSILSRDAKR